MFRVLRGRRVALVVAAASLVGAGLLAAPGAAQAGVTPGWLDASYGTAGVAVAPGVSSSTFAVGAVDSTGRALLLSSTDGTGTHMQVSRMTVGGALDPSFGTAGTVQLPVGPKDYEELVVGSDGIYVAGPPTSGNGVSIARLTPAGVVDSTYGTNGLATVPVPTTTASLIGLAQLTNGDIVVGGRHVDSSSPEAEYLAAVTATGALDAAWNTHGATPGVLFVTDYGIDSIAADGDKVVFVSSTAGAEALNRLTAAGVPDTGFGTSGSVPVGGNLSVGSDGDYYLSGRRDVPGGFALTVTRVLPSGPVDTSFGSAGTAQVQLPSCEPSGETTIVTPSSIYVFGELGLCADQPVVARFSLDGTPDLSFGAGGVVLMSEDQDQAGQATELVGAGVQPSGKPLVLTGWADPSRGNLVAALRLTTTTTSPNGAYVPMMPTRLLDTRNGTGAAQHVVGADGSVTLQVAGRAGVPSDARAVVLNVTAVSPTSTGYVTVYPAGTTRPTASNLNYVARANTPNLTTVRLGTGGQVVLFNGSAGTVDLLADISGYYLGGTPTAAGAFVSLAPARILDTRTGVGATKAPVAAHGTLTMTVAGAGGMPSSGISAVVVNTTVTGATQPGYLTVYPSGTNRPVASNLNFQARQTRANLVTVRLGTGGKLSIYNSSSAPIQLVVDVAGYYIAGTPTQPGTFVSVNPTRVLDTRTGIGVSKHAISGGEGVAVHVAGRAGVPATGAAALVLNATVTQESLSGNAVVVGEGFLDGHTTTSTLNFAAGQTVANLAITSGPDFWVGNHSGWTIEAIADLAGYFRS